MKSMSIYISDLLKNKIVIIRNSGNKGLNGEQSIHNIYKHIR